MSRFGKSALLALLIVTTAAAGTSIAAADDQPRFREAEFAAHLKFLAGDLLEGRAIGTRGGELTAAYIAAQFEAIGLLPISEEAGYFQQVPLLGITTRQETLRFALSAGDKRVALTAFDEVVINSEVILDKIEASDELVFLGYGIQAPEYDWDDYKGTDVSGKIVVMLVNDPDLEKTGFYNESLSYYGRWTYKEEMARAKGAKGLILLHNTPTATYPFSVVQNSYAVERCRIDEELKNALPFKCWVTHEAFNKALAFVGSSYEQLKEKADSRDFKPFALGLKLDLAFEQTHRRFTSPNVIGILPGTTLGDEAVIYSAHWDHFGIGRPIGGDNIYNGARDNATGVAAVICLARAYAEMPAPKRSVIFFVPTAEETGLLGSEYYAANPMVPLEKTAIDVNMDPVNVYGPTEDFSAGIVKHTDALDTVTEIGRRLGLELNIGGADTGGGNFRSDHFPLCARGLVALSVGSGRKLIGKTEEESKTYLDGLFEGRYHQPTDELDPRWRYDGTVQELNLLYQVGRHWADGAARPTLNAENPFVPAIRMRKAVQD
jgi:Zn-dependent M28 family amino/carboxypeptidase